MKTTRCGICPICGSSCGLLVDVEDGVIKKISGDRQDPHSRGYVCPKGRALKELHADPDRVLTPLKRNGDTWEEAGWDAAMEDIAARLARIRKDYGPDAIALFAGDGTTHSYETLFTIGAFIMALDIKYLFTANSMDALPRLLASKFVYNDSGILPIPDVKRTDHLLILGGNPVVTNGSVMTAPGFARYISGIQKRGGKVVVIDPRRNETAEKSDEHFFIRPETDAFLLLAMLHVIFFEGRDKPGRLKPRIRGYAAMKRRVADFTPELAAQFTGMDAETIRRLAHEFSSAESAVCYGRMGTCAQSFGTTVSMLIDVLNIVTGNTDTPGGAMFPAPAIDMGAIMGALGMNGAFAKNRTRISGLPDFNGEMPCAAMTEEIEKPGGIRALIVVGGNPAVSVPDSPRLVKAFRRLDLMVCLDPHVNATSCNAHYLLPPAIGLEHESYPLMSYATAIHNVAKWAPAVIDPPPGVKYDAEILGEIICRTLAKRAGAPKFLGEGLLKIGERIQGRELLKLLIAAGPHGRMASLTGARQGLTFGDLEQNPHGMELGPLEPRLEKLLGRRGRIDIMPRALRDELDRVADFGNTLDNLRGADDGTLILTSRRQLRFFNTSLHNIDTLATGPDHCTLQMHPDDASARGLKSGSMISVHTDNGEAKMELEITDRIMPGTVSAPFGWNGPQPAARQSVLNERPGTNINVITEPSRIDALSAMTAFNGTRVRVS